jgi:RNA polymerase sigma-70 factor (ECF subfamily)
LDELDEILRECQTGSEAECAKLVRAMQGPIFRLAWRITGNTSLAEEATADALFKIWANAGEWRGDASARTWTYRLAVRTILDAVRSQQRWWRRWARRQLPEISDSRWRADRLAEQSEQQERAADRMQAAMGQLEPADRALVHLYYFENRGLPELEPIFGVSRDALKMRLARARQKLKAILGDDDAQP